MLGVLEGGQDAGLSVWACVCVRGPEGFVAFGTVKKSKGCLGFLHGLLPTVEAI